MPSSHICLHSCSYIVPAVFSYLIFGKYAHDIIERKEGIIPQPSGFVVTEAVVLQAYVCSFLLSFLCFLRIYVFCTHLCMLVTCFIIHMFTHAFPYDMCLVG
jgi:hypothetical protein